MLRLFKAGLVHTENSNEDEFYFRDFNFYYTVIVSRYSLMRIFPGVAIIVFLLAFYFGSAVLFCGIMKHDSICPTQETTLEGTDGYLHLEGGDGSYNYGGTLSVQFKNTKDIFVCLHTLFYIANDFIYFICFPFCYIPI